MTVTILRGQNTSKQIEKIVTKALVKQYRTIRYVSERSTNLGHVTPGRTKGAHFPMISQMTLIMLLETHSCYSGLKNTTNVPLSSQKREAVERKKIALSVYFTRNR